MPTLADGIILPELVALRAADGLAVEGAVVRLDRQGVAKEIMRTWWQSVADVPDVLRGGEIDRGWDWPAAVGLLARRYRNTGHAWAVHADGRVQAAILYRVGVASRVDARPLVFVELLAAGPWNRSWLRDPGAYSGSGQGLLRLAILHSHLFGSAGRIGLTARTGGREEEWYIRQGFTLAFGPENGMTDWELPAAAAAGHLARMGVTTCKLTPRPPTGQSLQGFPTRS